MPSTLRTIQHRLAISLLLVCLCLSTAWADKPNTAPELKKVPNGWTKKSTWDKTYGIPSIYWHKSLKKNTRVVLKIDWLTTSPVDKSQTKGKVVTTRANKTKYLSNWTPTSYYGIDGFERTLTDKLWPGKDKYNTKKAAYFRKDIFLPSVSNPAEGYLISQTYLQVGRTSYLPSNPKVKTFDNLMKNLILAH